MTQTVDSSAWNRTMHIEALNFQLVVAPPERIGAEELLSRIARISQQEVENAASLENWLYANPLVLHSVLRGLSQQGRIDRGSFASYTG